MQKLIRLIEKFLGNINGKNRAVFFIAVILICIISGGIGISIELYISNTNKDSIEALVGIGNTKAFEEYSNIKSDFDNLFTNELKIEGNISIKKDNSNKDIVYSGYDISNEDKNYYSVNAKIPVVNIDNTKVTEINQKIRVDFFDKADSIMKQKDKYIEYNVSYAAFINQNILSIVVKSSYREIDSNERVILKTYNYDLDKLETISLNSIMSIKKLSRSKVQNKIKSGVKLAYNYAKENIENYYKRNLYSKIYKIKNTENYFYTDEGKLYLVYSYGNTDETNEFDVILFN